MLDGKDKKYIADTIKTVIKKAFDINNGYLVKEILALFNATNERIEEVNDNLNKKTDKILEELNGQSSDIDDHEKRIGKLEEKVFSN